MGRSLSAGRSPGSKRFLGHENPLKMHTLSINFISFTAKMHCICYAKKATLASWGPWPLCPPPKSAYVCMSQNKSAVWQGHSVECHPRSVQSHISREPNQTHLWRRRIRRRRSGTLHVFLFQRFVFVSYQSELNIFSVVSLTH